MSKNTPTELHKTVRNPEKLEELLLEIGADKGSFVLSREEYLCAENQYGVLHCAVMGGCIESVKLLLKYGFPIDDLDSANRTPLLLACSEGHLEIAKLLIDHGSDINHQDETGLNAAHWAYCMDHIDIGDWLLSSTKIDQECKDDEDKTPLDWRKIATGEQEYEIESKDDYGTESKSEIDYDEHGDQRRKKSQAFVINGEVNTFAAGSGFRAIKWLADNHEEGVLCCDD